MNKFWKDLESARSIKGTPIPKKLVEKLSCLAEESDVCFSISTASGLSRSKHFFKAHASEFKFYDRDGFEFVFEKEISKNEIFAGVCFSNTIAIVYIYFPYDGAYR